MSPIIVEVWMAILFSSVAPANALPISAIPWDSVAIMDTVIVAADDDGIYNDTVIADPHWCFFIRRSDYEFKLLGVVDREGAVEIQRDLSVIKAVLQFKHGRP